MPNVLTPTGHERQYTKPCWRDGGCLKAYTDNADTHKKYSTQIISDYKNIIKKIVTTQTDV